MIGKNLAFLIRSFSKWCHSVQHCCKMTSHCIATSVVLYEPAYEDLDLRNMNFLLYFVVVKSCIIINLANGEVNYDRLLENSMYPENTTASFSCNYEYTLAGNRSSTCKVAMWIDLNTKCEQSK